MEDEGETKGDRTAGRTSKADPPLLILHRLKLATQTSSLCLLPWDCVYASALLLIVRLLFASHALRRADPFSTGFGPRKVMAAILLVGAIPSGLAGTISSPAGLCKPLVDLVLQSDGSC